PDVNGVRGAKLPSHRDFTRLTRGARSEGDYVGCAEQLLHVAPNRGKRDAGAGQGRGDLQREQDGYDDLVRSRQDTFDTISRRSMSRLSRPGRRHCYGSIENDPHRRLARRSATAPRRPPIRSASKSDLMSDAESRRPARLAGLTTSTGTIAADGFPCRRISVLRPRYSASSTSAESRALASASEVFRI